MEKKGAKPEFTESYSWWEEDLDASQVLFFLFAAGNGPVTNFFSNSVNRFAALLILTFLYFVILQFIPEKNKQPFSFKYLLKVAGVFVLALLAWHNVETLKDSVTIFLPEIVASWLPAICEIGIIIFLIFTVRSIKTDSHP